MFNFSGLRLFVWVVRVWALFFEFRIGSEGLGKPVSVSSGRALCVSGLR